MLKAPLRTLFLALLLLPLLITGCSDSTGSDGIEGTYRLVSVGGKAVPAVVYDDSEERYEVLSGSIVLEDDGGFTLTFQDRFTDKLTSPASVDTDTEVVSGTYTVDGDELTIRYIDEDGARDSDVFTIDGNELKIGDADDDDEYVFRK